MAFLFNRTMPATIVTGLRRRLCNPEPAGWIGVTEDELFDILADSRRRAIITKIAAAGNDTPVSRRNLSRRIAGDETHMPPSDVPDERVDPVHSELSRTHLPILDDAGIIRWNDTTDEIRPGHSIQPIAEWLRAIGRRIDSLSVQQWRSQCGTSAASWR